MISRCEKILEYFIDSGLVRNPALTLFMLVALADLMATLSLFIPFQHLPAVARSHGLDRTEEDIVIRFISFI